MTRFSAGAGILALALGMATVGGWRALAEEHPQAGASPTQAQAARESGRVHAGMLDEKTAGSTIRASQLTGMTVQNHAGDNLGTVNDIVLDAATGQVRYAAVSYGGFLGLGDKLFAVPWEAFECRLAEDGDNYLLVLNASEEQIKSAPGFNQDHWPNFADTQFTATLYKHYGVEQQRKIEREARRERRGRIETRVGPEGVDVDVDVQRVPGANR